MDTSNINHHIIPKNKPCSKKPCESTRNKITLIAIGALIGFLVCMGYLLWFTISKLLIGDSPEVASVGAAEINRTNLTEWEAPLPVDMPLDEENGVLNGDFNTDDIPGRESLYVGVLTLEPHLETRATACNETWGQNTKIAKLEFYAELGDVSTGPRHDKVVEITDTKSIDAWHTEKSFLMLESICANHIDKFDWFLRTVDDSYINVDSLWNFLNNLDKSRELLLGHPTLPIDDSSYTALSGRGYCLGGPGLVFSRPLLQRLCPSLKVCRNTLSHLPADVAIAKCASEAIGIECAFIPEMQNYFMHSYEKNQFHLLNDFVNAKEAFSYHPLKSDWMMRTLHRRVIQNHIEKAIIQLDELRLQESYMEVMMTDVEDLSFILQNDMPGPSNAEGAESTTFYTANGQGLSAENCIPSFDLVDDEIAENDKSEHFAKTSVLWGHYHSCKEVLSTYHTLIQGKSVRTVDMVCTNLTDPTQQSLARTVMFKQLGPPTLLTQKHWKTSSEMLIVVEAITNDLKFIDFVLSLSEIAGAAKSNIILNVIDLAPRYDGNSQSERNDENSKYYLDKDFEQWYQSLNIKLNVFKTRLDKPTPAFYSDVMFRLSRSYPDATVLFTSVSLKFDTDFILRCRTLVRKGVQVYNPSPRTGVRSPKENGDSFSIGVDNLDKVLDSIQMKPLCMHINDFIPERKNSRKRRNKHNHKVEPLKVNSALDSHIEYI